MKGTTRLLNAFDFFPPVDLNVISPLWEAQISYNGYGSSKSLYSEPELESSAVLLPVYLDVANSVPQRMTGLHVVISMTFWAEGWGCQPL